MSKWMKIAALAIAASFVVAPAGIAAKAKKPVKKPVVKAPVKAAPRVVLGTTQLPGESGCKFGTTYTLGKEYPMNITLRSAEYTIDHVKIGEDTYVPGLDEKLLVLHMTYHNPQKTEAFVRWDSFGFTVVDPQSQNFDNLQALGSEETKESVGMNMKPAQKVDFFGVMTVPAKAEMPKLMIKSQDNLVMRFDLKDSVNKVKPLPAAYADPSDPSGCTALGIIKATAGTDYPVGMFIFKLVKSEWNSASKMDDYELEEGQKFYIVEFTVKNISAIQQYFRWDALKNQLIDVDGVELASARELFQASKDKSFSSNIQPGKEMTLRWMYQIPSDSDVKKFTVGADGGRTFEFDLK